MSKQWESEALEQRQKLRLLRRQHEQLKHFIDDSDASEDSVALDASPNDITFRNHFETAPSTVDYVFMWVDSSNKQVQAVIEEALHKNLLPYGRPEIKRVRDGTFEFALRSVLQARRLEAVLGNVYIVTSGELPSWLLPWMGDVPSEVAASLFTREPLRASLQPLVDECQGHKARPLERERPRSLYLYPHRALFPDAAHELPTFNSNAILATLHRLPNLSSW